MLDSKEFAPGMVFSEQAHYAVLHSNTDAEGKITTYTVYHYESGKQVVLSVDYMTNMLYSANQYTEDKLVTREDGKEMLDGAPVNPGIRTIFSKIPPYKVFCAVFDEQPSSLSAAKIQERKKAQLAEALAAITTAKKAKRSMELAAREAIQAIQDNPVVSIVPGKERILIGWRRDVEIPANGKYPVVDAEIALKNLPSDKGFRCININALKQLIVDGIRYTVKK